MDFNETIYILDGDNARITKWTTEATSGVIVAGGNGYGDSANQLSGYGMFFDRSTSTIWVADSFRHRIVKWLVSATIGVIVGGSQGTGPDQFSYPYGIFVDTTASNTIYVADTNNHRIQRWAPGASSGTTVAGLTSYFGNELNQLYDPQTLLVDTNGYMFIVDTSNSRIMKWMIGASSGVVIAGDLTSGSASNQLNNPLGIIFDSSGSLFVADTSNNRIQKFTISCCKYPLFQ